MAGEAPSNSTNLLLSSLLTQVQAIATKQTEMASQQTGDHMVIAQLKEHADRQWQSEERNAAEAKEYRQGVRDEISQLNASINALRMEQANHNQIITDIKTSLTGLKGKVQTYEDLKLQAMGGAKVLIVGSRVLYAIIGAALTAGGMVIQHWFTKGH